MFSVGNLQFLPWLPTFLMRDAGERKKTFNKDLNVSH